MSSDRDRARRTGAITGLIAMPVAITARLSAPLVDATVRAVSAARIPERAIDAFVESGAADRVISRVFDGGLAARITDRLLTSTELDRIVREVARSEEVLTAIRSQSAGLVDEIAGEVRGRTDTVDDALERIARRLLGRRSRPVPTVEITPARPPAVDGA
jgi:hypothetical protein